ncbi:hypothetical protein [Undibacterium oligocarboniphilum]|uniref:Uncharacterized protein n=1 Tax=Undibacterium oligocarboniphilum TaxID=666702 RepID=A0A850QP20_9BURK|nr:hypothetical protein [Undibacterium oligocarboniphilum]MBC3869427.1 hypothetical protein [Undibacterium oligocarboniphilum]NVO77806.1 hypothetical protein [Undibacterium oligocarboniphilum]
MQALQPLRQKLRSALLLVLLAAVLIITFLAYRQPAFILDLANRFVLC